jgi:catechol 2,3-dioxygenase-like lactoylglutathione lyase family enzyme
MSDTPSGIGAIGTVFVPVSDQERALGFFIEELGFEKRMDFSYGGALRWIEVAPPGATRRIALVPPGEGSSPGGDIARCAFEAQDIKAVHAGLLARGLDVDPEVAEPGGSRPGLVSSAMRIEDPVPPQFFLRDPDGNRFLVVQSGPAPR